MYAACFDITDGAKRHAFCENVKKTFGTVDVLVNSAGANSKKDKLDAKEFHNIKLFRPLSSIS